LKGIRKEGKDYESSEVERRRRRNDLSNGKKTFDLEKKM
jgi:hypothetical protein